MATKAKTARDELARLDEAITAAEQRLHEAYAAAQEALAQDALDATPVETPADALLDFGLALKRAVQGVDTGGTVTQLNAELARIFEAFVMWVVDGVVRINPMLRTGVTQALLEQSFDHCGDSIPLRTVFEIESGGDPPPLQWLRSPSGNSDHSQESWHLDGLRVRAKGTAPA